ncbi:mechanosensitive ion channel family protein [Ferruginibacter sp.]
MGAAVALAAKESLENLIASFIIFFDKPFTAGDTLKVNDVSGTVEKIGLRSTRIRTGDKTLVTVPNKQMVDSIVDNWSMRTHRRAEIKLELAATTSAAAIQTVINIIKEKMMADTDHITSCTVHLTEINKSGNIIKAEYFTHPVTMEDFVSLRENYYFFIKKVLEENKVAMSNSYTPEDFISKPPAAAE